MKTIRNILIILSMFFMTFLATAQDQISFSILQDAKLLVSGDKLGNEPLTTDLIFNMNWEGKQYDYYYFSIQTQYEHANLNGGYFRRYSVHGIWTLNSLLLPKLEIGFGAGIGMIHRNSEGMGSYSGTIDLSYPITKKLYATVKNEWVRRSDLNTPQLRYNLAIGLKYKAFNF
ncbi:hypothetical protein [uncultured Wocania sp.]|uniref:hypothetical protein n=1 Tax=uncultured Wocania sp. TaxID=2834404 RepID=UPI0030F8892E